MALTFDKTINLTAYDKNPSPKFVRQLSIIHEATDGELVQYYVLPSSMTEEDKNTHAIGIYDEENKSWSYTDYDEVQWNTPGQRIAGNRLERLGVKTFPDVGAIAFYKIAFRDISRIVAPVNPKNEKTDAPKLSAVQNSDGTITFTITPPEKTEYRCYRLVIMDGAFSVDHISYDLTFAVDPPIVSGTYDCFCIGFPDEGQYCSKDSNVIRLSITGKESTYEEPYYSKDDLDALKIRLADTYSKKEIDDALAALNAKLEDGDIGEY